MITLNEPTWSAPDSDGIRMCLLDVGAKSTLRGRRKRRADAVKPDAAGLWPAHWREILRDWVKQGGGRRKWDALLKIAGGNRAHDSWQLLDELLKAGLVEREEVRKNGQWQPLWVEFFEMETLRELCGLTNRDSLRRIRAEQEEFPLDNSLLKPLAVSLAQMPVERAVRRHELLTALDTWIAEGRIGTRRDFALFATGDTKGVSSAEWDWFETTLTGFEEIGISRHTHAVWLRAPITIVFDNGKLDLCVIPDCIALTPATLNQVIACEGKLDQWLILENRTVFERLARTLPAHTGALWVPGFAPPWWKRAVSDILQICPASVRISCDPDPAGIDIALDVGHVCVKQNVTWEPWYMDNVTLSNLPRKKPLVADDLMRLDRLHETQLPESLKNLVEYMRETGMKGEQEGVEYNLGN